MKKNHKRLNAPTIDRLLRYFERGHMNPTAPTEQLKAAMEPLFKKLEPLAPQTKNSEAKKIWLKVPRGEISDYDSYEDLKRYGEVETYEEYETLWKEDYSDEYYWYELIIVESFSTAGRLQYRGVRLGDQTIISATMDRGTIEHSFTEEAAVSLCELLTEAAAGAMKKLQDGKYNEEVNKELPYSFRTGVIRRSVLWEKEPKRKENRLGGLAPEKLAELKNLLANGRNEAAAIGRLKSMTANDFFHACAIGYKACGHNHGDMLLVDQYFAHADGRDEGLSGRGYGLNAGPGIDFDDPEAWEEWFFHREQLGGHPWEVCSGGNSTHVDLFVRHDRHTIEWKIRLGEMTAEEAATHPCGYYFQVAGKHRAAEAVNFYTALTEAGLPVILSDAKEILARFEGTDYVGIVPHSVISLYCESLFPEKYGRVIDFMHVYEEEMELWGDDIEWLPIEDALLADRHGGCLTEGE